MAEEKADSQTAYDTSKYIDAGIPRSVLQTAMASAVSLCAGAVPSDRGSLNPGDVNAYQTLLRDLAAKSSS